MTLSLETSLTETNKLEALRRIDQFRKWHSLDDKRYCLCCGNVIDGWQIRVTGPLQLLCPTEGCESIPMDWVLPTNEVLARVSILPNDSELVSAPSLEKRASKNPLKAGWRLLAGTLNRGRARQRNRF